MELKPSIGRMKTSGNRRLSAKYDKWWSRGGSNPRPRTCEARVLPIELLPQTKSILAGKDPFSKKGVVVKKK
jgi:hypothetical protein